MHLQITRGLPYSLVFQTPRGSEFWFGFAKARHLLPSLTPGFSEDDVASYRALYLGRFYAVLTLMKPSPRLQTTAGGLK